jgi:hypothetical protein
MDEIFIRNPSAFVAFKKELTQRERPQFLIDAETQRIADAEATELGKEVQDAKATPTTHTEQV